MDPASSGRPRVVVFEEPLAAASPVVDALARLGARPQALGEPAQVLGAVIDERPHAIVWVLRPNGLDLRVLRAIRDVTLDLPMLLLTSADRAQVPPIARELDAVDGGVVPTDPGDLDALLRRTLAGDAAAP